MQIESHDLPSISTVTGKLQTTIPARFARKYDIKTGTRLKWEHSREHQVITVFILPDPIVGLRKAQNIAAKNKHAATKLMQEFEAERAWQRTNGPIV